MNSEVRTMLERMLQVFRTKFSGKFTAWDRFLEFLVVDHRADLIFSFGHRFEWFMKDPNFVKSISEIYNPEFLTEDYYDHLGELYVERVMPESGVNDVGMLPTQFEGRGLVKHLFKNKSKKPASLIDTAVGTGRLLMATYKIAPEVKLFGIESDLRTYRIALTNFAIHKIPTYLLNADSSHETDLSKENGKFNWQYANNWNSCMNLLRPLQRSITSNHCLPTNNN